MEKLRKLIAVMGDLVSFMKNKPVDTRVLRPGDHIYCNRFSRFYNHHHHGIYLEGGRVRHLIKSSPQDHESEDQYCNCQQEITQGRLVESSLQSFQAGSGDGVFLFNYGVSAIRFWLNSSGTCSTRACDAREVSLRRATSYSTAGDENCESFAIYCKTGRENVSLQSFFLTSIECKFSTILEGILVPNNNRQPFSCKRFALSVFDMVVNHIRDMLLYDRNAVISQRSRDGNGGRNGNGNEHLEKIYIVRCHKWCYLP